MRAQVNTAISRFSSQYRINTVPTDQPRNFTPYSGTALTSNTNSMFSQRMTPLPVQSPAQYKSDGYPCRANGAGLAEPIAFAWGWAWRCYSFCGNAPTRVSRAL